MQLKILTTKDIPEHKGNLIELYNPEKEKLREYWKSIKNTTFIVIVIDGNRIIGASRIITDLYMCAMVFDVLVDPSYRNKGIGWKLMKKTVEFCKKQKIKNVSLVTDPNHLWLVGFYRKFGFVVDESNGTYMILNI